MMKTIANVYSMYFYFVAIHHCKYDTKCISFPSPQYSMCSSFSSFKEKAGNFLHSPIKIVMMMEPHCNKYFSRENKMKIKEMCDCIKIILVSIHILVDSRSQPPSSNNIRPHVLYPFLCNSIDLKNGNVNRRSELFRISN